MIKSSFNLTLKRVLEKLGLTSYDKKFRSRTVVNLEADESVYLSPGREDLMEHCLS